MSVPMAAGHYWNSKMARVRDIGKSGKESRSAVRPLVSVLKMTRPSWLALQSTLFCNVCSLNDKVDCIRLQQAAHSKIRDCCVSDFMETWFNDCRIIEYRYFEYTYPLLLLLRRHVRICPGPSKTSGHTHRGAFG